MRGCLFGTDPQQVACYPGAPADARIAASYSLFDIYITAADSEHRWDKTQKHMGTEDGESRTRMR